jgi:hypothetical protein
LVASIIKQGAFKDGDYIFYTDSATKEILFKGNINKGKTNGWYYFNKFNPDGTNISIPFLKMINSEPDGICKFDRYYFNFNSGKLESITVVDFTNSDVNNDSITVRFNEGKIDTILFCKHDLVGKKSAQYQKDLYDDTTNMKVLKDPMSIQDENPIDESFTIPANLYKSWKEHPQGGKFVELLSLKYCNNKPIKKEFLDTDTSQLKVTYRRWDNVELKYWKWYHFENTDDEITLYFDATKKLREVVISNRYSTDIEQQHTYELVTKINIGSNGNIQHINCSTGISLMSTIESGNDNMEFSVTSSENELQFKPNGKLRLY